jgi:VIT1/CCC1 family predicted Fe2+/Mn2+ transporter
MLFAHAIGSWLLAFFLLFFLNAFGGKIKGQD